MRGILIALVGYFLLTLGDVASKYALLPAGVAAVMIGRGLAGGATIGAFALAERDWRRLIPVRRGMVALRSAMHAGVSVFWYVAWQSVPLADSYALGFTAPLIMTLLAVPMLGERIRWRRALSTAVGFCGVLVMVRPGTALWQPAALVLVPGILGMAVSRIMARVLSTTETPECLTFWLQAAQVPGALVLLALGWPAPGELAGDVLLALAATGVLNGVAHWLMARAYAMAPVAAVAPGEYTMLLWGGALAYAMFHEVPAPSSLVGAAVVAGSVLYNLHRERVRRAEATR